MHLFLPSFSPLCFFLSIVPQDFPIFAPFPSPRLLLCSHKITSSLLFTCLWKYFWIFTLFYSFCQSFARPFTLLKLIFAISTSFSKKSQLREQTFSWSTVICFQANRVIDFQWCMCWLCIGRSDDMDRTKNSRFGGVLGMSVQNILGGFMEKSSLTKKIGEKVRVHPDISQAINSGPQLFGGNTKNWSRLT